MRVTIERFRRWLEPAGDVPQAHVLLIAAHPDDEVIGATSVLLSNLAVTILHTTDGAPADASDAQNAGCASPAEYARLRLAEMRAALALAGRPSQIRIGLGISDQDSTRQLGLMSGLILEHLVDLAPDVVITHPYEGGHPDHDAAAFAVRQAVEHYSVAGHRPLFLEMTSYHLGPAGITTGRFLPMPRCKEVVIRLSPDVAARKRDMLACFQSQQQTLNYFAADEERFRETPTYDWTHPPHAGRLYYEQFPWGTSGEEWRQRAIAAIRQEGW